MSVTFRSRLAARAVAVATLVMLSMATSAPAQSFNVDIDLQGTNPALGSGVPSSTFGGAAGQPGVWNAFQTSGPTPLFEIGGVPTAATVAITSTSTTPTILGFNNPDQTGDFGLLLNDGAQIGTTAQGGTRTYRFSGLIPGPYFITTYTARPGKFEGHLLIDVPGSAQGQLTASGVPTANTFTEGVTHVVHHVLLTGAMTTIDINLTDVPGAPAGYVDGFQVILLPEPASLAALIAPALLLSRPGPRLRRGIIRS